MYDLVNHFQEKRPSRPSFRARHGIQKHRTTAREKHSQDNKTPPFQGSTSIYFFKSFYFIHISVSLPTTSNAIHPLSNIRINASLSNNSKKTTQLTTLKIKTL